MARGRPRKSGKRTKSGRLSLTAAQRRVAGNDRAEEKKRLFGQEGVDAIGRAWRAGLLGEPTDARRLVDAARALSRSYKATFEHGRPGCALNQDRGGSGEGSEALDRQKRLLRQLLLLRHRPASFDELVLHDHPDSGPHWLDRLIFARSRADRLPNHFRMVMAGKDGQRMREALQALSIIAR